MAKSNKKQTPLPRPQSPPPSTISERRQESRDEDSILIQKALNGDQRSFRRLRHKYHDAIFNLIARMIRNREEVEDLTQEAFIKAFTSLASFNDEYAFSTWLYKIATNNCIDHIRRKKLLTFSIDKPDKSIIADQRKKILDEAINSLPPKYRQVIILRHTEEKEYQEIARQLKLPLGTVKAHIFRAREMLYKYLRDKMRHY